MFKSESEIGEMVVSWLETAGWDVYQEVAPHKLSRVADIVAKRHDEIWVVECKQSLGLQVMSQAYNWLRHANFVSVAVPKRTRCRMTRVRAFAENVLIQNGIGLINVSIEHVSETIKPERRSGVSTKGISKSLCQEQKTYSKAGAAGGGYFTPFKKTVELLRARVTETPGSEIKDIVASIEHHYSSPASARKNLMTMIERGVIDDIRAERNDGKIFLYMMT